MNFSSDKQPSNQDFPTVSVDFDGQVLCGNDAGKALFLQLVEDAPHFSEFLSQEQPFQVFLSSGQMVKASMTDDPSGYLLEWHTLTQAEARLSLLQAVSGSVNSSLILEDIFDSLGKVLRQFIPFTSGTIVILDDSQNSTKVIVSFDTSMASVRGDTNVFVGNDPVMDALLKIPHSQILPSIARRSVLIHPDTAQTILVPLISKGLVIGFIGLSGNLFTPFHLHLLQDVSEQLAVAIENARLYWQTQSQAGREFLINQITKSIRQSLDVEAILQTTVHEVGQVMGLSRCLIHYWGASSSGLQQFEYVLPGVKALLQPGRFTDFERALFSTRTVTAQQYNPFVLNDVRSFPQQVELLEQEQIKSLAVFPILLEEKTFVGTISLHQCDVFRSWLGEEIDLLKAIAEHVSVALHQGHLFQEKENQRRKLEEALDELQQAQIQLIQSEKMAVLGQFVAGIAHEINTPLGTITANDDTVRRCLAQIQPGSSDDLKYQQSALELLEINKMASERIQEIVKNLRNFARLDDTDLKFVDLHEGLDSTLLLVRSSLQNRIRIEKQYGELPLVECFPGLLNQVFMNLIVNAIQSIDDKGTITLTSCYSCDRHQVEIHILDTGKGIVPEHLPRIFDPGFTTKGVGVGTGLGLALCYKIMEKHHGQIKVDSTVGQGTLIKIILPVQQTQQLY